MSHNNNSGYFYIRMKFKTGGIEEKFFKYLKQKNFPLKQIILDSLKILWFPYLLASLGSSKKDIQKEAELSYQKFIHHFQLMTIQLECQPFIQYSNKMPTNIEPGAVKVERDPSVVGKAEANDLEQYISMFEDEQSLDFG